MRRNATSTNGTNGTSTNGHTPFVSRKQDYPNGFEPLCKVSTTPVEMWLGTMSVERLVNMCPPWNPQGRTELRNIKALARSINVNGMLQFPVVNKNHVCEGNRRVKAAELLGWDKLTVTYCPTAQPATYAELNDNQKSHSPAQKIEAYLKQPLAVSERFANQVDFIIRLIGKKQVVAITRSRLNVLSMLSWAKRAAKYCGLADDKVFLVKAIEVQFQYRAQKSLRDWIENDKGATILTKMIFLGLDIRCYC